MKLTTTLPALCRGACAILLCAFASAALASDEVMSVKGKQIEVFAVPDNAQPGVKMAVSGLPWHIKEEKNSFFRVDLNGRDVWVDSMQVVVRRTVHDACGQVGRTSTVQASQVAGSPGAGPARCK
ncbi:hypothetical protein [Massilia oculi]|uniref:hypothetical protein n=1 Tax=Massilia oculi TaxID=945844 RepID=UPI001AAFA8BA|nr:hypothetical protein [Massilia oculi]